MTSVAVCPICDIAGCYHIREASEARAAMRLPEVRTLVRALNDAVHALEWCARDGRMAKSQSILVQKWAQENRAILTRFTASEGQQ